MNEVAIIVCAEVGSKAGEASAKNTSGRPEAKMLQKTCLKFYR